MKKVLFSLLALLSVNGAMADFGSAFQNGVNYINNTLSSADSNAKMIVFYTLGGSLALGLTTYMANAKSSQEDAFNAAAKNAGFGMLAGLGTLGLYYVLNNINNNYKFLAPLASAFVLGCLNQHFGYGLLQGTVATAGGIGAVALANQLAADKQKEVKKEQA